MHPIELMIHKFLEDVKAGKAQFNEELVNKFSEECRQSLIRQIHREPRSGFTIRMSNIGKPICQLQFEQSGIPGDYVEVDLIRNLYGDLTEKLVMFLLYASGVPVISEQEYVKLNIGNISLGGTLDLSIDFGDGLSVWDIKSASDWTFKNKYNKTFEEIINEDTYGYGEQLFLYAEAKQCAVGGLIFVNKASSEIRVVSAPKEQRSLRSTFLKSAEDKINAILTNDRLGAKDSKRLSSETISKSILYNINSNNAAINSKSTILVDRQFEPEVETFYKKPTGNLVLPFTCSYCPWKFKCWENLQLKPKAGSKAKNPPMTYYIKYED